MRLFVAAVSRIGGEKGVRGKIQLTYLFALRVTDNEAVQVKTSVRHLHKQLVGNGGGYVKIVDWKSG